MKRLFWGIDMSGDRELVEGEIPKVKDLLKEVPVKWVEDRNLHITLNFLGNVEEEQIPKLVRLGAEVAGLCSPFQVEISGIGGFPNMSSAKSIWMGVKLNAGLDCIHNKLMERVAPLSKEDNRKYIPHITVARSLKGAKSEVGFEAGLTPINHEVKEFFLFESLMEKGKVKYFPLESFQLNDI